jgi:hypothetical protein
MHPNENYSQDPEREHAYAGCADIKWEVDAIRERTSIPGFREGSRTQSAVATLWRVESRNRRSFLSVRPWGPISMSHNIVPETAAAAADNRWLNGHLQAKRTIFGKEIPHLWRG